MNEFYDGNGDSFSKDDPTVKEFLEKFLCYSENFSKDKSQMESHNVSTSVSISCLNNDKTYRLIGISLDRFSCGCESGITLEIYEE